MSKYKCLNNFTLAVIAILSTYLTSCSNSPKSNNNEEVKNSTRPVKEHNGKVLFNVYCTSCHNKYFKTIGPALNRLNFKLPAPQKEYFLKYVRNNESLRNSGDKYAIDLFKEYGQIQMPIFEKTMKDSEILEIYDYLCITNDQNQ